MMEEKKLVPKRRFIGFDEEWIKSKLGDIVEITMGHSPKSSSYTNDPTNYILVQGNADMKKNRVTPRIWTTQVTKIANKNDLILTVRAPVGEIGKTDYDVVLGRGVAGLKGNEFIFQYLIKLKMEDYWVRVSTGSTFDSVSSDDINEVNLFVPKHEEQQKIGEFFKVLDDRIANQERKIAKVKALKSAYLTEMFPQQGETVPKRRFAGFKGDWKEMCLGDLSDSFDYGLNAESKKYDGENKYIRITDIDDDTRLFVKNNLTSPNIDYPISDRYILDEGDILFARTGASVGKTYRYNKLDGKVYYAGFLIKATIKDEHDYEFIFQNTLTKKYENFVYITSQRSGQPGINAQEYATYKLMIPTLEEQQKIGQFFKNLDDQITTEEKKLEKLKKMKEAYLEEMFV